MKKNSEIYQTIRELICLACYTSKNLTVASGFLGEYEIDKQKYKLYLYSALDPSIIIQCENNILYLMIENESHIEYMNGPIETSAILHFNSYKNISINDINTFDVETIDPKNIINKSKLKLQWGYYRCSEDLYHNDNEFYQEKFEEKRYKFNKPEIFDNFLKENNFLPKVEGTFSVEIVLNLIEQVYSNFNQIYTNNKIEGILSSLSQEELLILKERVQENSNVNSVNKILNKIK